MKNEGIYKVVQRKNRSALREKKLNSEVHREEQGSTAVLIFNSN